MSLLTVRQAAERLGVGYSTLKHWIYEGRVRTRVTSGGHHRIPDAEVDRLLAPAQSTAASRKPQERSGAIVAISGRNQLRGYVDEVRIEGLLAQVRHREGHRGDDRPGGADDSAYGCTKPLASRPAPQGVSV